MFCNTPAKVGKWKATENGRDMRYFYLGEMRYVATSDVREEWVVIDKPIYFGETL